MVWLCFPGMTSSLANHRCTLSDVFFSATFLFLTFLNIHIYFIILKTYDQQFTLTTKKPLHIIFKAYNLRTYKYILLVYNIFETRVFKDFIDVSANQSVVWINCHRLCSKTAKECLATNVTLAKLL